MRFLHVAALLSLALCCGCVHSKQQDWTFNNSVRRKPKLPRKLKAPEYEPPPASDDDPNILQDVANSAMQSFGSGDPNEGRGPPYHR